MRPLVWLALPPEGDDGATQRASSFGDVDAPPTTTELIALVVARLSEESARTGRSARLQLSAQGNRLRAEVRSDDAAVAGGVVWLLDAIAHRWGVSNEGTTRLVWFEVPLVPPVRYVAG